MYGKFHHRFVLKRRGRENTRINSLLLCTYSLGLMGAVTGIGNEN